MRSLVAAGVALTVLLLSLMLGKKNKLAADRFLIGYLIFALLRQVYTYFETMPALQSSYWMLLGKGLYLLHAPFFFLYVYALTQGRGISRRWLLILFAPCVAYTLHFLYFYFLE